MWKCVIWEEILKCGVGMCSVNSRDNRMSGVSGLASWGLIRNQQL